MARKSDGWWQVKWEHELCWHPEEESNIDEEADGSGHAGVDVRWEDRDFLSELLPL